jgi:hypothetical protein
MEADSSRSKYCIKGLLAVASTFVTSAFVAFDAASKDVAIEILKVKTAGLRGGRSQPERLGSLKNPSSSKNSSSLSNSSSSSWISSVIALAPSRPRCHVPYRDENQDWEHSTLVLHRPSVCARK